MNIRTQFFGLAVVAVLTVASVSASAQQWDTTSGPPATVTCLATNGKGHVFAGTANSKVYRTTDKGGTWLPFDQGIEDGGPNFYIISDVRTGANDDLYACVTGRGLFRSTNDGESWVNLALPTVLRSSARVSVSTKILQSGAARLFVGVDGGTNQLEMFMSDDNGGTWTEIPKSNLPTAVSSIFATFQSPNSDLIFTLVSYNKGLYRSNNLGQSWTRIDSDPNSGESDDNFNLMTSDANGTLWLGRNSLPTSIHSKNACIMMSTNDGTSWEYKVNGWNNNNIINNRVTGIAFSSQNEIFATTEKSGTFYSTDAGESWASWNTGVQFGDGSAADVVVTKDDDVFLAPLGEYVYKYNRNPSSVDDAFNVAFHMPTTSPNPASDIVHIGFGTDRAADVRVDVFDLAGSPVLAPFYSPADAGRSQVSLDVSGMAPGVYVWRVTAGAKSITQRFVVTH